MGVLQEIQESEFSVHDACKITSIGGIYMKVYTTDKIRNVVLLGHGGCGKTSLAEAMAYLSGITSRMGKVTDKNTISDYGKEEQARGISINTTLVPIEWEGCKINIIDTPGFFDFVGEVEEAMNAAGAAIIVVSGKAGVEVGTEKAWELCEKYNLPRIFYVDDMDIDNASFRQVVADLTDRYGKKIAPFHLPIRENEKFVGYINVITETGNKWQGISFKNNPQGFLIHPLPGQAHICGNILMNRAGILTGSRVTVKKRYFFFRLPGYRKFCRLHMMFISNRQLCHIFKLLCIDAVKGLYACRINLF